MRQNIRCFQQAQKNPFASFIVYEDTYFIRRLSQTTFNRTSNKNLHITHYARFVRNLLFLTLRFYPLAIF
jgi:hypothetical protein